MFAGETRDLMPDLVSKSGLSVQSERTANVGPSPIERDQVETELQIGISSHVGPSKLSTGAPVLERDSQEACDLGLEEERLLYDLSESPSCCDQGPEESRSSTEGEADVRSGVLEPVSEAKDVGRWKEETVVSLKIRIKELETQLHDQTEWAQQKVMQAARRLSKDLAELKALRQAREEMLRLKNDQKALEDSTMKKLSEMESAVKKASGQVDRANAAVRRLENENAEVRAEMEAAKLNAAESIGICQEIAKRDKKSSKQAQAWERQKVKLQENLSEERQKLTQMQQQLAQAKERQQQAEVSFSAFSVHLIFTCYNQCRQQILFITSMIGEKSSPSSIYSFGFLLLSLLCEPFVGCLSVVEVWLSLLLFLFCVCCFGSEISSSLLSGHLSNSIEVDLGSVHAINLCEQYFSCGHEHFRSGSKLLRSGQKKRFSDVPL
jgi:hypothetical protein